MLSSLVLCAVLVLSASPSAGSREFIERRSSGVSCPKIMLNVGDDLLKLPFKASADVKFDDRSNHSVTYKWGVSKGARIIEGQGTRTVNIEFDPDDKQNKSIDIIVEVGGIDPECPNRASATVANFID